MKLTDQHYHGFDWDPANEAKILARHGMDRGRVERFFGRDLEFRADQAHSVQELRYLAAGPDDDGKPMLVVFTFRLKNGLLRIRPISARRMHLKEKQRHG